MDPRRAERVAETIREELAEIVGYEMSDPRLAVVVVTGVEISRDSRRAEVRVQASGDQHQQREALKALEGARHYLRREVASRLRLFRAPELYFEVDAGDSASRVEELLERVRKERAGPA
ncbi:MAG: 30S ribosome-binding factor RbfA [Acidobacteriota bacterium]